MKFSGKNVLVTGASRGIGAEVAKVFAGFNLKVWINYNASQEKAMDVKRDILNCNPLSDVELIRFDVADESAFVNAIQNIIAIDGRLDYLVNNAGITKDGFSMMMGISDYDDVMNVNARSCFIGSKEALKSMATRRFGSVVNISSITAEMGNAGQTNYASSKGAIIAMTKSFALEGASRGVRFNVVTPGIIETDMTSGLGDDVNKFFLQRIPLKRFGTANEVANVVAFLMSDYAGYMTGEVVKVNGGMYM